MTNDCCYVMRLRSQDGNRLVLCYLGVGGAIEIRYYYYYVMGVKLRYTNVMKALSQIILLNANKD